MEEFKCSRCKETKERAAFHEWNHPDRPCFYICKECRSSDYFKNRYGTQCPKCSRYDKLSTNDICRKCNKEMGLKECKTCKQVLPVGLCFYDRYSVCKNCLKECRKEKRSE